MNTPAGMVPAAELATRMQRLRARLERTEPDWRLAVVIGKVNLFYLTGTSQSGALVIPRGEEATLFVRRSYSRACEESRFPRIEPMRSFSDLAERVKKPGPCVYLEKDCLTLAHAERFNKGFGFQEFRGLDQALLATRALKSPFELERMTRAGQIHREVLEEVVPTLLKEGMSEAELGSAILAEMLARGHHGVTRVGMFDTELFLGHVSFGDSSIYPNPFDGPGGVRGLAPAVPLFGSRERRLERGQIVFVDVGCGVEGYHTDKTMIYAFGSVPKEVGSTHQRCLEVQNRAADMLRPGTLPSAIYEAIIGSLDEQFRKTFMGRGREQVRFLGHGVGLFIDEFPVIAKGFDEPLEAGMTIALEPKSAIPGVGMVGMENTFLVSEDGGHSLTGSSNGLRQL